MTEPSPGVPCAYCSGRHARAAEVRRCWERSVREGAPDPAPASPPQLTSAAPAAPAAPAPPAPAARGGPQSLPTTAAGPVLGRSVLVAPGGEPPAAWAGCERVRQDAPLEDLEGAWRERRPLVVEVDGDLVTPDAGETGSSEEVERRPVWSLPPSFSFEGERRSHALLSNAVDARGGAARWALAAGALALGARAGEGAVDVLLPDGTPALCDGGPLAWQVPVGGAAVVPRLSILAGSLAPFGANETGAALAPDQLAAVLHPGGAARIIAPAGSGKTRVLTERARHLLRSWRLPGEAVTLVAFNKRAADEMRERTPDLPELQVRTLNALGLGLVSRAGPARTIDEREVRAILDRLVDLPRRANADPAAAWIEALSAVRLGLQAPEEVEAELGGDVDGLPRVFDAYRRLLAAEGLVDFDEQIYRAAEILLQDPAARRAARASCRVLLVDELQDLTPAHLLLVRLLAGPDGAVFGVGDDDQTIYGYSGASPEWLVSYRRYFPAAGEHALEVNYRCPVPVVTAARTLLTHNHHRVGKAIVPAPGRETGEGELVVRAGGDGLTGTVEAVAGHLAAGAAPGEVAVLARVNVALVPVQVALLERQIPVRAAAEPTFLSRGAVQAALAWLRLATSPAKALSSPDLALAARRPSRALSPRVVEWIAEQRSPADLRRLAGRLSERDGEKIEGFLADLEEVRRRAASGTTAEVLAAVRDEVGLDRAMELLERSRRRLERSAQTDDLDALVALASLHPEPGSFEAWLRDALAPRSSPEGVVLSTIHRVKGREWPHVVLHGVDAGLLPHRLATDLEEERRVFHVGLTRATATLHVVAGEHPSPFLAELTEPFVPGRAPGRRWAERAGRDRPEPERAGRAVPAPSGGGAAPAPGPGTGDPAAAETARQALRSWRSGRAAADGKPAFVILHDRTIEALAQERPATMEALARVKGIGPAKLEAYGDELLAVLGLR